MHNATNLKHKKETKALTGNEQLSREKNIHSFTSLKQKKIADMNLANIKKTALSNHIHRATFIC